MSPAMRAVAPAIIAASIVSCASASSTHYTALRELQDDVPARALIVDAKQRVVVATKVEVTSGSGSSTITRKYTRICAEPSPDALSALAASQGLAFGNSKVDLSTNLALAESAGSIGLRTQSIQLMRDAMFRLCEAYLSDALTDRAFETMLRRFQSSMIAILAIEQLTGTVRSPGVVLSGNALVGAAELAATYTEKTVEAQQKVTESEVAEEAAKKTSDAAAAAAETKKLTDADAKRLDELITKEKSGLTLPQPEIDEKNALTNKKTAADTAAADAKSAKAAYDNAKSATQKWKSTLQAYDSARVAALGGSGNAGTTATISMPVASVDSAALQHVANAVKEVSRMAIEKNFSNELCTTVLLADWPTGTSENDDATFTKCLAYLEATVSAAKSVADSEPKIADAYVDCLTRNPADPSKCDSIGDAMDLGRRYLMQIERPGTEDTQGLSKEFERAMEEVERQRSN